MSKKPIEETGEFDWDVCYECGGYGDDYSIDENGELVSNCESCPFNPLKEDDE